MIISTTNSLLANKRPKTTMYLKVTRKGYDSTNGKSASSPPTSNKKLSNSSKFNNLQRNNSTSNILTKLMLATKKVCNNLNAGPNVIDKSEQGSLSTGADRLRLRTSLKLLGDGSAQNKRAFQQPSYGSKKPAHKSQQLESMLKGSISLKRKHNHQHHEQQQQVDSGVQRISSSSLRLVNCKNKNDVWAANRSLSCQSIKQRKSKVAATQPGASVFRLADKVKQAQEQRTAKPASVIERLVNRRPSGNRLRWLNTILFIVINALLVVSFQRPEGALGAPLALYGRPPDTEQPQGVSSIWPSDGLLTVQPTSEDSDSVQLVEPVEDELDQMTATHLLIDQVPMSADQTELDSLLLSDYIDAANEQRQQQQQLPTDLVRVKPTRNWFSVQSEPIEQQIAEYNEKQLSQLPDDEVLWVQRRRLNRDRALEPPAWLRERPIRRDDGVNLMADMEPNETGQPPDLAGSQPIKSRTIRGRQLRQSNEMYNEILRHLIEEALDSRDFLEDLYDELESRLSKTSPSGKSIVESAASNAAPNLANGASNDGDSQLVGQKTSAAAAATGAGGDDAGLVVVNDEVSETNNDDNSSVDQQNQAHSERLLDSLIGVGQQGQRPEQLMLQKQLAQLINRQPAQPLADQQKSNLMELLQSSVKPMAQADQFHVVEDIDQLDQNIQTAQATQTSGGVGLPEGGKQQFNEEYQPIAGDYAQRDAEESLGLKKRDLNYLFDNWQLDTDTSDDSTKYSNDDNDQQVDAINQEDAIVMPMRKSVASGGLHLTEPRQQAMRTSSLKAIQRRPPAGRNNDSSIQFINFAIRLIQSDYFSRRQLLQFGNKVKYYLENLVGLPRDCIVGLFPVSSQQLMIELDQNKLSPRDRFNLMQSFNYNNRGSMLMNWPQGSPQNPVPILRAILNALKRNEDANNGPGQDDVDTSPAAQLAALEEVGQLEVETQREPPQSPASGARSLLVAMPAMLLALSPAAAAQEPDQLPTSRNSLYSSMANADDLTMEEVEADESYFPYGIREPSQFDSSFREHWQVASKAPVPANNGPQFAALLAYLGSIRRQQEPLVSATSAALLQRQKQHKSSDHGAFYLHLAAIFIALVASLVILKLIMRRTDSQVLRMRLSRAGGSFRSLWSSPSSDDDDDGDKVTSSSLRHSKNVISSSALVVGEKGKHLNGLEAGNFGRRLSNDSGLDTIVGTDDSSGKSSKSGLASTKHLDQLSHRLMSMLSFSSPVKNASAGSGTTTTDEKVAKKLDLESNAAETASLSSEDKPFRTSRSYIKSLIDALTRPRPNLNEMGDERISSTSNKDDFDEDDNSESQLISSKKQRQQQVEEAVGGGIIVSQMDISAAHLILDYMEKHLDDKERLRREWLELNAINQREQNKSKANQLVLQRLAKVALLDENRDKNRNSAVVPFDRNRVRLRSGFHSNINYNNNNKTGVKQRSKTRNKQGQTKLKKQPAQTSDYINASFIYDDDPRSPTHIISQGPNEQTIGQFWQMIWEQEVSVIVMLTRLNENGQQMCHCYWPTGADGAGEQGAALSSPKQAEVDGGSAKSPGRRGSVTSVFSASALARPTSSTAIIAASDELDDNVLYFEFGSGQQPRGQSPAIDEEKSSSFSDYDDDDNVDEEDSNHYDDQDNIDNDKGNQANVADKQTDAAMKLEVHLISEHVSSNDYLVRNMYLVNRSTGETRTISQFHYLAWPENKTPENVRSLLQFRRLVLKSYRNLKSPILVHCSDGAGRSGTYTLLDLILERIRNGAKEIDPRATLEHLRDQRIGLCATQSQFEFVLVALAEEIQIILNALPK